MLAGFYTVVANVSMGTAQTAGLIILAIYKNGIIHRIGSILYVNAVGFAINSTWIVYLNGSSDYVDIRIDPQTTGNYISKPTHNYVQISYMRSS